MWHMQQTALSKRMRVGVDEGLYAMRSGSHEKGSSNDRENKEMELEDPDGNAEDERDIDMATGKSEDRSDSASDSA